MVCNVYVCRHMSPGVVCRPSIEEEYTQFFFGTFSFITKTI